MKVFDNRARGCREIALEEFLSMDDASGIYLGKPGSVFSKLCAVNYGRNCDGQQDRAV